MSSVRKFEFVNSKNVYSVIETPPDISPKEIPKGDGRFLRTWVGEAGTYKISRLKTSESKFVSTLCKKHGHILLKKGEHL